MLTDTLTEMTSVQDSDVMIQNQTPKLSLLTSLTARVVHMT